MKLLSIEPTPSPNAMKLNIDEKLPLGMQKEYTQENKASAPVAIQRLLALATAYLGMIGGEEVLPDLFRALQDPSVSVRRTAGDTLSDLGSPEAIGPMCQALKDPNKLVRQPVVPSGSR